MKPHTQRFAKSLSVTLLLLGLLWAPQLLAQSTPAYLQDRRPGIATSMFGTYIEKDDFLVYPFYEFYYDSDSEYSPNEHGFGLDEDYFGKEVGHEFLIFLGYGYSDWLAFEFEAALYTSSKLDKSPDDPSAFPSSLEEDGLGDVEGQIRWRYNRESLDTPEFFSFFEYVLPLQEDKTLIGTSDWEFKLGTGAVKGFEWGTMTARLAVEYDGADSEVALGEYAIEYLKRINDEFRVFAMVEGSEDEVELIGEFQWFINEDVYFKIGSGFGITKKATDIAPEVGFMMRF